MTIEELKTLGNLSNVILRMTEPGMSRSIKQGEFVRIEEISNQTMATVSDFHRTRMDCIDIAYLQKTPESTIRKAGSLL